MCGINGIFAYHYASSPVDEQELTRTRDYMQRRGPDGKGTWISPDRRIGLGHRRLSVIDLSDAAGQPMFHRNGELTITYNGEIYNYQALRRGLESKGCVFKSRSDTEVLLHLYAERGEAMVHELRGMYAFAIYDAAQGSLFLARDPFGIKPLYYCDDGWTFRFASQVKALLAGGGCRLAPCPAGFAGFYLFGSVPEPYTMFASIRALPAGSTMRVGRTGAHPSKPFFSIAEIYRNAEAAGPVARDMQEAARETLLDSVRCHLVADIRVGAFLSAGVDSGALVGLMRDAGQADIQTVTVSFDEFKGTGSDEGPMAADVARTYGASNINRVYTKADFEIEYPKFLAAMDQPTIDGLNTWFVSKAVREAGVKVAISGLGGDEIFNGYPSFRQIPQLQRAFRWPSRLPLVARVARHTFSALKLDRHGIHPKLSGVLALGGTYEGAYLLRRGLFMPWELPALLGHDFAAEGLRRLRPLEMLAGALKPAPRSATARVAVLESSFYMRNQLLRDTDWSSMAHGLEVRVPLVDPVLLRSLAPYVLGLSEGEGKRLLAQTPSRPLPEAVVKRPKSGFSIPLLSWLATSKQKGSLKKTAPRFELMRDYACTVAGSCAAV